MEVSILSVVLATIFGVILLALAVVFIIAVGYSAIKLTEIILEKLENFFFKFE